MSLQEEINKVRPAIKTENYFMSIGEWIKIYQDGEIDIHPKLKHFVKWTIEQKANFIESILIGIPIPPIFVFQTEAGTWEVIDGIQRLSTIFEFVGILTDKYGTLKPPFTIEDSIGEENSEADDSSLIKTTPYLPSLAGKKWEALTQAQRLFIKRSKIGVHIVLLNSDINSHIEKIKLELFQLELFRRLNTGGSGSFIMNFCWFLRDILDR